MAIVFPDNPSDGQVFTYEDSVFVFNSAKNRWSSQSFASVESTFEQIKTSLDYLGVDTSTVSLSNVAEVIKTHNVQDYTPKVQVAEEYVRPSDWISMPSMTASDEKFVGLFAVMPNDTNVAYIYAQGNYTVDWGDGTSEDISSGQYAYKSYDFSSFDTSDSTLTSKGYKQALITVTPQAGSSLSIFYLNTTPPGERADSAMNWLDIKLSFPNCTNLHINSTGGRYARYLESVDILNVNDSSMYYWFSIATSLKKVRIKNSAQVTSTQNLFSSCYSLEKIDLFDVDTSSCTNFAGMFASCFNLIEVPDMDISSGTSFSSTFSSCNKIQYIPKSFTFDNATNMYAAFYECSSLLEMPTINSTSITSFYRTFFACRSMSKVLDEIYTSNCTNFREMFDNCSSMVIPPIIDTSNGTNLRGLFEGCYSMEEIPFTLDTSSAVDMSYLFNSCFSLKKIPEGVSTSSATQAAGLFRGCYLIEEIPELDTSNVTSFYEFFETCFNLKSCPTLNVSSGTNFREMFSGCSNLEEVPDLTTSSLGLDFESMFSSCISLKKAPIVDISSANEVNNMFYNCRSLTEFNASDYDFSNPFNLTYMFRLCYSLKKVNGTINATNATRVFGMFEDCFNLEEIDINIPSSNSCNYQQMFSDCRSLKTLEDFDFQNATSLDLFALTMTSLSSISNVTNIAVNVDFRNTNLDASDFVDLFTNSLSTVSGKTILISGALGATQLTAEQIAIATNKGWTVTT